MSEDDQTYDVCVAELCAYIIQKLICVFGT